MWSQTESNKALTLFRYDFIARSVFDSDFRIDCHSRRVCEAVAMKKKTVGRVTLKYLISANQRPIFASIPLFSAIFLSAPGIAFIIYDGCEIW